MYLSRTLGTIASIWGVIGAITLLSFAVSRMTGHTMEAFTYQLGIWHYLVLVAWTFFMGYSEGYRGFQKGYSPRVASRAIYLRDRCTWLRLFLAPFFCLGFLHATRRRQITVVVLLVLITLIVVLFRQIPQPWRGVLDFGVVVGLSWGILATIIYYVKFWIAGNSEFDPEVVEPTQGAASVSD